MPDDDQQEHLIQLAMAKAAVGKHEEIGALAIDALVAEIVVIRSILTEGVAL